MRRELLGWMLISFLVSLLIMIVNASALTCPLCGGKIVEYCNIEVYPAERMYDTPITVNVTMSYKGVFTPIEKNTTVKIMYYDENGNLTTLRFGTDKNGLVTYTPGLIGYYIVKVDRYEVCEKSLLIYVNTTCGDGACGGKESLLNCALDCGSCGDGICDLTENKSCSDCAICDDGACTAGETRSNCLKDCVFCGDQICDYLEDRKSCANDCPSGGPDGYCDGETDGICDHDCDPNWDSDCEQQISETLPTEIVRVVKKQDNTMDLILITVIILLVAVALAVSIVEIKRERNFKKARIVQKKPSVKKSTMLKPVKKELAPAPASDVAAPADSTTAPTADQQQAQ